MPDTMIRSIVRGAYDLQKLRIETGNRLVMNFRAKLGINPGEAPEDDSHAVDTLRVLKVRYEKITDGVVDITRKRSFDFDGVISNYTELALIANYLEMCKREQRLFRDVRRALAGVPIWDEFLLGVSGCGPAMGGVIVSEIDISKARYVSSLWKYAGLDVAGGSGRSRRAEHLVDVEYEARDGQTKTRKSITFNPLLKTKLVGVLGPSFLKVKESPYKTAYYDYKHRLENSPRHEEKSKGHRHNMAIRYAVKLFLRDLYNAWRPLEGLPVAPDYAETKLGIVHGG